MRLKRSLNKLYEAGCNLTRRMCIYIYCDKTKKVKVRQQIVIIIKSVFELKVTRNAIIPLRHAYQGCQELQINVWRGFDKYSSPYEH